jgi:hypothetical protein
MLVKLEHMGTLATPDPAVSGAEMFRLYRKAGLALGAKGDKSHG